MLLFLCTYILFTVNSSKYLGYAFFILALSIANFEYFTNEINLESRLYLKNNQRTMTSSGQFHRRKILVPQFLIIYFHFGSSIKSRLSSNQRVKAKTLEITAKILKNFRSRLMWIIRYVLGGKSVGSGN